MGITNAVRDFIKKFDEIRWGYDGDCGSEDLVRDLENFLDEQSETPMKYIIKLVKSNGGCFFWTEDPRWNNNICGKRNMGVTKYDNFGDACQVLGNLPKWHQDEFKIFTVERVVS